MKHLIAAYPKVKSIMNDEENDKKLSSIARHAYRNIKERIWIVDQLPRNSSAEPDTSALPAFINTILTIDDLKKIGKKIWTGGEEDSSSSWGGWVKGIFTGRDKAEDYLDTLRQAASKVTDAQFLQELDIIVDRQPLLAEAATTASEMARGYLRDTISSRIPYLVNRIWSIQEAGVKKQVSQEGRTIKEREMAEATQMFIHDIHDELRIPGTQFVSYNI
jgi:hypothetical protein